MTETALAERTAAELVDRHLRRIQISNVHKAEVFFHKLSSIMENTRFISFYFKNSDPFRTALSDYFTGSGLPDVDTAFEAGWRTHLTEIALVGSNEGMQAAAELNSLKEPLKKYLIHGGDGSAFLVEVLSSFTRVLPTVFLIRDFCGSGVFDDRHNNFPPLVVLTAGSNSIPFPDLVLDSGLMPLPAAREYLLQQGCTAPVSKVLEAAGGKIGLIELYAGISKVYGIHHESVSAMLTQVLDADRELADFAAAAGVLAPGFIPGEAADLSSVTSAERVFRIGREINLWRGFTVCSFCSPEARRTVLCRLSERERQALLLRAAEAVPRLRGESSVSLEFAGDLLMRAGAVKEASRQFERAAELENRELRKAELYRKAALFSGEKRDEYLFRSRLSLHREQMDRNSLPISDSLRGEEFPELSPEVTRAVELHGNGFYHRAETLLANFALRSERHLPVAVVEMGKLLYRRNMVEASMNVMKFAADFTNNAGLSWLEAQALFSLVKAYNRKGRFQGAERGLGRLLELAASSGNRLRLIAIYNLYANSLLLQRKYDLALKVYTSSLRTLGDSSENMRTVILNNMSVAQRRLFRTDDALGSLMRLVRSAVSQGSLAQASTAYGNMARLFIDLSRFDSAEDCLDTMLEFRELSRSTNLDDSVLFISSQIAFARGQTDSALSLIEKAISLSRVSGNMRRLSLNLVKKGSMLLRIRDYDGAAVVLSEAEGVSELSKSKLNAFVARMKCTAARCFAGELDPCSILAVITDGNPEDTHRGEQFYYHWRITGSRQSLAAAAQLLSKGLLHGLHYHSYLYMLHEIAGELPSSLADALPLVHNYPS